MNNLAFSGKGPSASGYQLSVKVINTAHIVHKTMIRRRQVPKLGRNVIIESFSPAPIGAEQFYSNKSKCLRYKITNNICQLIILNQEPVMSEFRIYLIIYGMRE